MLDGSDSMSIVNFLPSFQKFCDRNRIHEGAAMWLFHFFMQSTAQEAFNTCTCLLGSRSAREEGKFTSHGEFINYFFALLTTNDLIAQAEMNIMHLRQPTAQSAVGNV